MIINKKNIWIAKKIIKHNQNKEKKKNNVIFDENKNLLDKFKKYIKYIFVNNDGQKYRYSLDKYKKENMTAYYVCFDSNCKGRGKIFISFNKNDDNYIYNENIVFILTKQHTKEYQMHSYKRNEYIKTEVENNLVTYTKLQNIDYLKLYLKELCIRNKNLNKEGLYNLFQNLFPNFKIRRWE